MFEQSEAVRLIAAVARGDSTAFDRLYQASAPKLFGLILRMVRDRPMAEDILQDSFVRIWTRAATYAPDAGEPLAWMAAIARNRAIDHLRAKPSLRKVEEEYDGWFENLAEPQDRERGILDAEILRHCLGALDEMTRTCVLRAYCEGFSGRELADRYGRPENTIKTWLRRGLAALKACLDKDG